MSRAKKLTERINEGMTAFDKSLLTGNQVKVNGCIQDLQDLEQKFKKMDDPKLQKIAHGGVAAALKSLIDMNKKIVNMK